MTGAEPTITALPTRREPDRPFDPPAELAAIRERAPLVRMTYPDGHLGWLATGHAEVRGARRPPVQLPLRAGPPPVRGRTRRDVAAGPVGDVTGIDAPEHTRFRKLLAGLFTVRRMRLLTERIQQIAADHLDAMERSGNRADLVPAYAEPIPALTICELLGVPYADRDAFRGHVVVLTGQDGTWEEKGAAVNALQDYLLELVRAKRAEPTDDVLGALTTSDLSDDELAGVGAFLLGAGLDTTGNMLALGTFALLRHPEQLAALRAGPDLVDGAVEKLLRYLTIAHTGLRAALEDVEVEGTLVRAGETVTLAMGAANRDPRRYPDPDRLDLRRSASGHLALGHGLHQCLGQHARFPGLRLDVDPADVPVRGDANIHGLLGLPVTW